MSYQKSEIEVLREEIERYKKAHEKAIIFLRKAEDTAFKNNAAANSLESEREMNAILTKENEQLYKYVDHLTHSIRLAHDSGYVAAYGADKPRIENAWQEFVKANNLRDIDVTTELKSVIDDILSKCYVQFSDTETYYKGEFKEELILKAKTLIGGMERGQKTTYSNAE